MRLHIGITDGHAGWEYLLKQEGLPYAPVTDMPKSDEFAVLVAGDQAQYTQMKFLQGFLQSGGAVLCSARAYASMTRQQYMGEYVQYFNGQDDPVFGDAGVIDLRYGCQILPNANTLRTQNGNRSAFKGTYEGGAIVVLPFDPAEVVIGHDSTTKSFFTEESRLPFEVVSSVDKDGVRRLVAAALRYLYRQRSLPYCHLWYHPNSEPSVFAFRVDSDYGNRQQIGELDALSREYQVPFTWFIDVRSQQQHFDVYKKLAGHELGVHCFDHRRYAGPADCEKDLRTALMVFELSGSDPQGAALPYGQWGPGLGEALRTCRFNYSSEFGYDYDGLPSYPLLPGGWSSVLQIPIHPISIGSLRRQGYVEGGMERYFLAAIDRKLAAREPIVFLHHPNDGHPEVVRSILARVRELGLRTFRMEEYARWWKRRLAAAPGIIFEAGRLLVEVPSVAEDVTLHIISPEGREGYSPLAPVISLDRLTWKTPPSPLPLPERFLRSKEFNYRIPLTKGVDGVFGFLQRVIKLLRSHAPARNTKDPVAP